MEKKERKIILVVFIGLILVGLLAVDGFGINVDENPEIDIARMDLKEYVRLFFGEGSKFYRYMDGLIGNLMDSVEIDHGEAVLYPVVVLVSVLRVLGRADLGMLSYHMYIYVLFLFGLLAAYEVGKYLTGRWFYGLMTACCLGLNPLLFGMSFINNKDMSMLSLSCICIWFGIQFVEKKTWKWTVLWAIVTALTINMRIVGLVYLGLIGLLYLYEFWTCNRDRTTFLKGLTALLVTVVVFVAITPATWYSLVGYFAYTASNSVEFLRNDSWELYCGTLYNYLRNPFPWHYFLVKFAISTPLLVVGIYIIGQIGCLVGAVHFKKEKKNWNQWKYIIIFEIIIWVPMLYFMIRNANVTFRHFWFMYPLLTFTGIYIVSRICDTEKIRKYVGSVLIAQMVICVGLIVVGHPFETTYFNILAGKNVDQRFEYVNIDYYKAALENILKMDDREDILISSDNLNCYFGIKQAWEVLNPEKKNRIQIAEPDTEECANADYHVYGQSVFVQENKMAKLGVGDVVYCTPEEKFNSCEKLGAYGKTVISIWYNR